MQKEYINSNKKEPIGKGFYMVNIFLLFKTSKFTPPLSISLQIRSDRERCLIEALIIPIGHLFRLLVYY